MGLRRAGTYPAKTRQPGVVALPIKFVNDANGSPTTATATGLGYSVARTAANTYRITLTERYTSVDAVVGADYKQDDVNGTTPYVDVYVWDKTACGHVTYTNPDAADLVSVVAALDPIADGALTIVAQPDYPRRLQVRIVDANSSVTAGTVTLVGTGIDGSAITEVIDFGGGGTQTVITDNVYAILTSATVAGVAGAAAGDTIGIGVGAALGLPIPVGVSNVAVTKLVVDTVHEAVAAGNGKSTAGLDTTARALYPTTAPNATHDYDIFFTYGGTASKKVQLTLFLNTSATRSST